MRLLKTDSLEFEEFSDPDTIPKYAILSHMWGGQEVSFREMLQYHETQPKEIKTDHETRPKKRKIDHDSKIEQKNGFGKIQQAATIAANEGYEHIWVDTCAINKDSSAELSEAINSMFK
jgi:Heterokaryon incompatibility protein (HET)